MSQSSSFLLSWIENSNLSYDFHMYEFSSVLQCIMELIKKIQAQKIFNKLGYWIVREWNYEKNLISFEKPITNNWYR